MNLLRLQRPVRSRMMLATVLVWLISGLVTFQSATAQEAEKVNFETRIKPLLEKHCLRCHGPEDEQGDFRIDDRETVMSGYVDPGDALFSDLYLTLISDDNYNRTQQRTLIYQFAWPISRQ